VSDCGLWFALGTVTYLAAGWTVAHFVTRAGRDLGFPFWGTAIFWPVMGMVIVGTYCDERSILMAKLRENVQAGTVNDGEETEGVNQV
jgi:hypothetical protein